MSDPVKSLLEAYYNDITSKMVAGQALDYIHDHYIIQSPSLLPPDWSCELPLVLIYVSQPIPVEPHCVPSLMDRKFISITLSLLAESVGDPMVGFVGDSYYTGVLTMAQDIETLYRRETFSLSDECHTTQIDYSQNIALPFRHIGIAQAHLTFQHDFMDMFSA